MRTVTGSFLWHALYRDVNVPRDPKTMVVSRPSRQVLDHALEGATSNNLKKLCALQRENNKIKGGKIKLYI